MVDRRGKTAGSNTWWFLMTIISIMYFVGYLSPVNTTSLLTKKNILKVQASLKALPHGVSLYKTKKKKSQQRNLKSQQDLSKVLVFFVLSSVKWVLRTLRSFIAKFECYLSYNVKKKQKMTS